MVGGAPLPGGVRSSFPVWGDARRFADLSRRSRGKCGRGRAAGGRASDSRKVVTTSARDRRPVTGRGPFPMESGRRWDGTQRTGSEIDRGLCTFLRVVLGVSRVCRSRATLLGGGIKARGHVSSVDRAVFGIAALAGIFSSVSFAADCNANAIDDSAEIEAEPSLDCNANGELDSCELTAPEIRFDGPRCLSFADTLLGIAVTDVDADGTLTSSPSRAPSRSSSSFAREETVATRNRLSLRT